VERREQRCGEIRERVEEIRDVEKALRKSSQARSLNKRVYFLWPTPCAFRRVPRLLVHHVTITATIAAPYPGESICGSLSMHGPETGITPLRDDCVVLNKRMYIILVP
jgi:hypothetical protein